MMDLLILIVRKKYLFAAVFLVTAVLAAYRCYESPSICAALQELLSPLCMVNKNVFLDPGHGGVDPGCNDPRREIYEEDINLKISQLTRDILSNTGAQIIMSREKDRDYVLPKDQRGNQTKKQSDLTTRIKMATDAKADIFVSLHVNATGHKSYAGAEAFYNPANPYSILLAQAIQNHLRAIPEMTKRTAKPGDYFILKNSPMPAVIVEMGFLSNAREKELLIKPEHQQAIALSISRGIADYFKNQAQDSGSAATLQVMANIKPKVAIVIDDMGSSYNKGAEEIFKLNKYPLTLAIMPNMNQTTQHAARAEELGFETLIHMPMEPDKGKSSWLGPGGIKHNMGREEIMNNLKTAWEQVPNAVGLNNHMGSLITRNEELMLPIMEFLKEKEMFYLDSRTNGKTVSREVAGKVGVPYTERTHFLDNTYDYNSIRAEILKTADYARKNGYAIAIGHAGPQGLNTAKALADTLPLLEEQGIELVYVSELVISYR